MTDPLEDGYVTSWELITPVDMLYALRNQADLHAKRLQVQIEQMRQAITDAELRLEQLEQVADGAQDAAELIAASDLMPTAHADIPERSGLTRKDQA